MSTRQRRFSVAAAAASLALLGAMPAAGHNAGHFTLPNGTCHEIGSFKHHPRGLDLIPETPSPFDEYGASFAAFQGKTPILPGPCPR
jgi:hypothetical protein